MSIHELVKAIESAELDATLGLISGFTRFIRVALREPEVRALLRAMSVSRAARVVVANRAAALVEESVDLTEHVHARDIGLAVYMLALHETGDMQVERLASKLVDRSAGWWSRRIARWALASIADAEAKGLRFLFDWQGAPNEPTSGRLRAWVAGELVWYDSTSSERRGVQSTWPEFLEHLSDMWPRLLWEDGYPAPIGARTPAEFEVKTRDYLDNTPARLVASMRDVLDDFRRHHDLSSGLCETMSPLWLVRQGHDMWLATPAAGEVAVLRPRREVIAALRVLGDEIAAHLHPEHEGHARALDAWEKAGEIGADEVVAISTGLEPDEVRDLGGEHAFEFSGADDAETELMAAARMVVTADYRAVLPEVLAAVAALPPAASRSDQLDSITAAVRRELALLPAGSKPYDQGYAAANWLRAHFGALDTPLCPVTILESWGVTIVRSELSEPEIEAIAVWGPRYGPAIILNERSKYSSPTRENISLAHELAHLLLDRGEGLPLAEVLGGNVPKLIEQRARALAAELLLPRRIAGAEFADAEDPALALEALSQRFRVSHEVVAWQARNAAQTLPPHVEAYLRMKVSRPQSY